MIQVFSQPCMGGMGEFMKEDAFCWRGEDDFLAMVVIGSQDKGAKSHPLDLDPPFSGLLHQGKTG